MNATSAAAIFDHFGRNALGVCLYDKSAKDVAVYSRAASLLAAALGPRSAAAAPAASPEWQLDLATLSITDWAAKHLSFHAAPKQAEVLTSDRRNIILCCHRKWGKTTTVALKAFHFALSAPNRAVGVLAPSLKQGGLTVARAREFAASLGIRFRRYLGREHSLLLPNGSRIYAIPHRTNTALGDEADVLVVDEAAVVKDEVLEAVSPSISRKRGGQWFLSTPARQTGTFYRIWNDASDSFHRILSTVADTPEIDREYLEMYRRASPARYEMDFECRFAKPPDKLVPRDFVEAIRRYPKGEGPSGRTSPRLEQSPETKQPPLPFPPHLREMLANMVRKS
jgi:hypothetical protein